MTHQTPNGQTRVLPESPSLETLKKQAKALLKSHEQRQPEACRPLSRLNRFADSTEQQILDAKLRLSDCQFAVALSYGFKAWSDLKQHVLGRIENLKYVHIHCGDASARPLQNSSVPGDVQVWREIYIEGPVPGNVSDQEFRRIRAEFLGNTMPGHTVEGILQGTNARYQMLAEAGRYGEVILWFDSCMFDQTIMVHLIDLCAKQNWPNTKLSLICVDEGLGALPVEALVSLMPDRKEVSPEQIALARRAWQAFTAPDPTGIEELLVDDCSSLPFLADALKRHLQQFPSVRNGLNRTQNQILQSVSEGASKLGEIFVKTTHEMEPRPFMGDTSLWLCIDELATCEVPLLKLDGPCSLRDAFTDKDDIGTPAIKDIKRWNVTLTETGDAVRNNQRDHIHLNGIERWLGGVHLTGQESQWRWDEEKGKLLNP